MPLETFKTQVLLLHSEQSTLDKLSKGFNDRYTVHCATSGSEALSTLGQVPIHVIVSAQQLPGMSGLDALREAKKRSPETIGILLAGEDDNAVEALVGAKEVFQIVRGTVTPESIRKLIDNATQQARLLALAESANDMAANPDEPAGEHIVMETSENGSTIISDGTGRMPALNPAKVAPAANVGARTVEVLVLTKDEGFLKTIRDSARGLHNIIYATTIAQADDAVRKHKVGVAVIDAAMFGSKVEKLTLHLRGAAPRLVSIVAGRRDDGEMLMDLINRGKVYRFLLKPVSPGRARLAIDASVKHHLEAPESAFKAIDAAALGKASAELSVVPGSSAGGPAKSAAKPASGAAPAPRPVAKSRPVVAKRGPAPANTLPEIRIEPGKACNDDGESPNDTGLADAFDRDEAGLSETMTGIIKSFRKDGNVDATAPGSGAPAGPAKLPGNRSMLIGIGAAVVAVVAVAAWAVFGGGEQTPTARQPGVDTAPNSLPVAEQPAGQPQAGPEPAAPVEPVTPAVDLDAVLDEARAAAGDGRVYAPPGDNAIELYLSAAAQLPDEPLVTAELDDVIDRALGMAEASLLDRRADDVAAALERVALADPDNSRLPFLNAQLADMRLRTVLDEARSAVRELRFDDADAAVAQARDMAPGNSAEIDVVADEIAAARIAEQVDAILAEARARLEAGALTAPENDNAVFFYRQALDIDAGNAAAQQGLTVVASRLALLARAEIDQRNFAAAEELMNDARSLDPASIELANATEALAAERALVEEERLAEERRIAAEKAEAERRAAEEKAAAERAAAEKAAAEKAAAERAAAEKVAAEKAAAEKAAAERAAAEKAAAEKVAAEKAAAERAAAARQAEVERLSVEAAVPQAPKPAAPAPKPQAESSRPAAQSQTGAAVTPPPETTRQEPERTAAVATEPATQAPSAAPQRPVQVPVEPVVTGPVPVSSLSRTRYVAPKYPRSAERRGLSGWVDVVFTVDLDGTVRHVEVRGSDPGDTFVDAAVSAVEDWEFEPVIRNGAAVEQQAAVRLMFAIE